MNFFKRFFGRKNAGEPDPVHNDMPVKEVEPTRNVEPTPHVEPAQQVVSTPNDKPSRKTASDKGNAATAKSVANDSGNAAGVAESGKIIRLEIDESKCREGRCKFCTTRCPKNAIRVDNGKVVIDASKCDLCGICYEKCPCGAVVVVRG